MKINGYTSMLFCHITKVNNSRNFLFAAQEDEALSKGGLLLKERICSSRSKFFSLSVGPTHMEGKRENCRVASPENVPIHIIVTNHLKVSKYTNQ